MKQEKDVYILSCKNTSTSCSYLKIGTRQHKKDHGQTVVFPVKYKRKTL